MNRLTETQQELLSSFQTITAQDNIETSIELLQSENWNVQAAVTRLYDEPPIESETVEERRSLIEEMEIDDSLVMPRAGGRGVAGATNGLPSITARYWLLRIFAIPMHVLAWPASKLYSAASIILGLVARILRIRPGVPSLRPRNPFARDPNSRLSPTAAAERWLRSLEELTSCVRYSRAATEVNSSGSTSSAIASGSSSGMRDRGATVRRAVPDFWVGGYEEALSKAKGDVRVLLVVLTCEEHDDDTSFKMNVLTDPDLLKTLASNNILTWGGDIRQRDAYQVGKTLQFLSLPFVGFIALQPRSASSTQAPRMTVISRLEGSPLTTTSASTIVTHLTTIVLPRVAPYFNRLRAQTASRNADRILRAEQDRAYDEAGRKDTERVLKKRAEEEIKRKAAELAARDMEEERIKEERVRQLVERGIRWRRWKRKTMAVEPDVAEEGTARISVRLGDGRVAVRRFRATQTIEDLYDFVECSLDPREAEEEVENSTISVQKPLRYEHIFEFQLATTFPRVLLSSSSRETIQDAGGMIPSANLIVEGLAARRISMGESNPDDDEEEEEVEEED